MTPNTSNTYRASGVDLDDMDGLKDRIRAFAAITHGPEVLKGGNSFAGLYQLSGFRQPVLVASTDGVGTKLKIAAQLGHYESIGQDLVTLNVNDILTKGARPLFFLDYISFSEPDQQRMETLLRGIIWGCREVGCALIGGETAQMPGLYTGGDFDLAGFVVGAVERERVIDGSGITPGDILLGIPSSGLHTNGFSLVRKVFDSDAQPSVLFRQYPELGHGLGEELLVRHRCYYPLLEPVLGLMKGLAHITGGGIPGKMPAILPPEVAARFQVGSWSVPPIFSIIQREGKISAEEMYRVFNMGLGMVAVCTEAGVPEFKAAVPEAIVVGRIVPRTGDEQVVLE
ncbi:MAG: phosphoribosylformylglycinamidine cyclo-ligase [Dehalococcoidia bacterium]|nr:phosphoribosylformylglycinamidine cyclo-ligase [Dehalococcoidia bacterium]MSQ17439.1 phosphoribosylformylglycinamidine cyclo-ligase [Dehalococcoidia bacterium]